MPSDTINNTKMSSKSSSSSSSEFSIMSFIIALAFGSILFIIQIVYTAKTSNALNDNDIDGAKSNFKIAAGFVYFFAAISLLGALFSAIAVGYGKK